MSDAERDAYLQGALRHAPDADVAPPPSVSEAILREARGAASQAAPLRPRAGRASDASGGTGILAALLRFGSWLARPPVAGAFASMMVATLAGVMWWGEPIERTLERPLPAGQPAADRTVPAESRPVTVSPPLPAPVASAAAAASAEQVPELLERSVAAPSAARLVQKARQGGASAPAAADGSSKSAVRGEANPAAPRPASSAQVQAASRLAKEDNAPRGASRMAQEGGLPEPAAPARTAGSAGIAPSATAEGTAPPRSNARAEPAVEVADEARALAAGAVAASPESGAEIAPDRAQATAARPAPVNSAAETSARAANSAVPAAAMSADGTVSATPAARAEARRRDGAPSLTTGVGRMALQSQVAAPGPRTTTRALDGLHMQLASQGERWSWRVRGAAARPVDEVFRLWLARLDAAAAGAGWHESAVADRPEMSGTVFELLRDGQPHGGFRLDVDAVQFTDIVHAARPLRAALPGPLAQQLKADLEALAR